MKNLKEYTKFMGIVYLSPSYTVNVFVPIDKDVYEYSFPEVKKMITHEMEKLYPKRYFPGAFLSSIYAIDNSCNKKHVIQDSPTVAYNTNDTIALGSEKIDQSLINNEKYKFFQILRKYGIVSGMSYNTWCEAKDAKEFYNDIKKLFSQDDKKFVEPIITTNPLVINDTNAYKPKYNEKIKEYSLDELFCDIDQMPKYLNEFFSRNAKNKCEKN